MRHGARWGGWGGTCSPGTPRHGAHHGGRLITGHAPTRIQVGQQQRSAVHAVEPLPGTATRHRGLAAGAANGRLWRACRVGWPGVEAAVEVAVLGGVDEPREGVAQLRDVGADAGVGCRRGCARMQR